MGDIDLDEYVDPDEVTVPEDADDTWEPRGGYRADSDDVVDGHAPVTGTEEVE